MQASSGRLDSRAAPPRGELRWGDLRLAWVARPLGDAGGDRLLAEPGRGDLCLSLADAPGSGAEAARWWARHGEAFDRAWRGLVDDDPDADEVDSLRRLVDPLDARLHAAGGAADALCLSAARWRGDRLTFASCGYGTHVLARAAGELWWAAPEALFGVKLGWLGPERRGALPRGFLPHRLARVDRVLLVSDGLLGDDHRDPGATLSWLEALGRRCCALPFEEVLDALLAAAPRPQEDDLSLLLVERGG